MQNKVCSRATPKVTYEKKRTSHAWQQESKHLICLHSAWSNLGPLVFKSTICITSDILTSVHHVSSSWNTIPYNHDNVTMWCNAIRCDTMYTYVHFPVRWHFFPGSWMSIDLDEHPTLLPGWNEFAWRQRNGQDVADFATDPERPAHDWAARAHSNCSPSQTKPFGSNKHMDGNGNSEKFPSQTYRITFNY